MAATMAGKSVGKTAYLMVGMSAVWKDYRLVVEKAVCSVVRWDNLMVDLMAEKLVVQKDGRLDIKKVYS